MAATDGKSRKEKIRTSMKPGIVVLVGFVLLFAPLIEKALQTRALASGEVTRARIIGLNTSSAGSSGTTSLAYMFEANGRTYCTNGEPVSEGADPEAVCKKRFTPVRQHTFRSVHPGASVTVVYDPNDPRRSRLIEPVLPPHYWILAGLFLMGAAGLAIYVIWRGPLGVQKGEENQGGAA
ncbi:DUF3592 domain-containing protein [Henriciella aquimarina]|uniref:DUF3592 domain-containing protein n=1 Tax=Henriciella aquimarina TaxID=545261 RepID=UPI001301F6E1|nr:DUF3592 domain-containing protein [Henriciella aquimarina]